MHLECKVWKDNKHENLEWESKLLYTSTKKEQNFWLD